MVLLYDTELAILKILAAAFDNNEPFVHSVKVFKQLGITKEEYESAMRTLIGLGAATDYDSDAKASYIAVRPTVFASQQVREIEVESKRPPVAPDFVDQIRARFRRNPHAAWVIVIAVALAFMVVLANNVLGFFKGLGFVK